MKQQLIKIIGAFLIGLGIPIAVIQVGDRLDEQPVSLQPQMSSTQSTADTVPTQPTILQDKIWVAFGEGKTLLLDLEDYLVGVLLAEMPTAYDDAALQAQAVVARTYALKRKTEDRHPHGAVCTGHTCCQAYITTEDYLNGCGYTQDVEKAERAVRQTTGMVLTYEGDFIEATYFHCSGGRTEDAAAVWGVEYPYLKSVASPGEENMEYYFSQESFTKEELEEKLGITLTGKPHNWIGWTIYTIGGGVDTIYFAGKQYSGTEFRKILDLNSTAFTLTAVDDSICVISKGKGHRVGMSQSGAQAMALNASTYQQILFHYYQGTRIDKMADLG